MKYNVRKITTTYGTKEHEPQLMSRVINIGTQFQVISSIYKNHITQKKQDRYNSTINRAFLT